MDSSLASNVLSGAEVESVGENSRTSSEPVVSVDVDISAVPNSSWTVSELRQYINQVGGLLKGRKG